MGTEFVLAMELFTSASIQRIQGRAGELYLGARLYCGPIPSSSPSEMQKAADAADISVLFFSAGANFWVILGHFWAILSILGQFGQYRFLQLC